MVQYILSSINCKYFLNNYVDKFNTSPSIWGTLSRMDTFLIFKISTFKML